jgi:hypothetical protein
MKLVAPFCTLFFLASSTAAELPSARVPVLLELFTSEGCSSCPPADRLLEQLDRQPIGGADLVVLSEHVDYWNQLGWKDPFSSPQYSDRQRNYARALGGDVYTPELVVDGAKGFVGSDESEAQRAIRDASRAAKAPIRIEAQRTDGKAVITIHMDRAVEGSLYLALAHDTMKSQVTRGENSGHSLSHVAVVYSLEKVGKVGRDGAFDKEITIPARAGETTRIVAFVSKQDMGHVVAVGQARL